MIANLIFSLRHHFTKVGVLTLLSCISSSGAALEITIIDPGPGTKQLIKAKKVKPVFPLATAADVMCGKSHHMARFRLNNKHVGMPFSVTAKKMTRIKIRWDHPDKVLFPFPEKNKTIVFPHAGGESRLYFRAYAPVSGNVYIMDDRDAVIKTCPYSFLPVKRFRQSINVNINETEYDRLYDELNSALDDKNSNVSVNYRISSRNAIPDGATWSWSVGVSQSESSTDSRRANSSFSYNW